LLSPTRHPPVDQRRIIAQQNVRAEAETFHDSRTQPFEQAMCVTRQPTYQSDPFRLLKIYDYRFPRSGQNLRMAQLNVRSIDPDNLRTVVGKHHARKRRWPDASHLDYAYSL
jgi:hypothetical protein